MAQIGWGKPRLFVRNLSVADAAIREIPTPVEDSYELSVEQGDKLEAKIEGGQCEDVKYKDNTYSLSFDVRVYKGRQKPFADVNGVVADEFEFWLRPEDPAVPAGVRIAKCRISTSLKATAADGMTYTYTVSALENGRTEACEIGTVTVADDLASITFDALEANDK